MCNVSLRRSSYLEDQQVQQDVKGAWGGGRHACWSLPLCYNEGQISHLLLTGINELHLAAVDQLVVLHLTCRGRHIYICYDDHCLLVVCTDFIFGQK